MPALAPFVVAFVAFGVFVVFAYRRDWLWTGLPAAPAASTGAAEDRPAKTLWDWLQLLGIPVVLASLAFVLNDAQSRREQRRDDQRAALQRTTAADAERELTLRTYLAQMSDLMLDRRLLQSKLGADVRNVARTATLTAVRRLDSPRRGLVLQFLAEADLIRSSEDKESPPVRLDLADLSGAGLVGADLVGADLGGANLRGANLKGANLSGADLLKTDLSRTNLTGADLLTTDLFEAKLVGANLSGANLTGADLIQANLRGANLTGANLSSNEFFGRVQRADLMNADLTGANLAGASLAGAKLFAAKLVGAELTGVDLTTADLTNADVTNADLRGARGVKLSNALGTPAHGP